MNYSKLALTLSCSRDCPRAGGKFRTVILLGEFFGQRLAQREEVGHGILDKLGAGCAAKEEAGLGVLGGLGRLLLEGTLRARIAGFSVAVD